MSRTLYITDHKQLEQVISRVKDSSWVSMDTEANSMFGYPERVCLIQVFTDDVEAFIDPLSPAFKECDSLNAFFDLLMDEQSKRLLIMHGADYDLRLLFRAYHFKPLELFDTMLAAKLLGEKKCGLGDLCSKLMEIELEKKYQKSDWSKRPLSKEHLNYAIKDAFYLPELKRRLEIRLKETGRLEWHRQNCQRLIKDCTVPAKTDPRREWRLNGSSHFTRRQLAFLRAIWYWREEEGRILDRPLFFIIRPETMLRIAMAASADKDLRKILPHWANATKNRLFHALDEVRKLPANRYPMPVKPVQVQRFTPEQQHQLEYLTKVRDQKSMTVGIEASLIGSRADLVGFVRHPCASHLTRWQRDLLGIKICHNKLIFPEGVTFGEKASNRPQKKAAKPNSRCACAQPKRQAVDKQTATVKRRKKQKNNRHGKF